MHRRSITLSEYYNQLLIPVSKTVRPDAPAVARFVEQMVEAGYVGEVYAMRFSRVVRIEPRLEKFVNPFTGKMGKRKTTSRRFEIGEKLGAVVDIVSRAEAADEYTIFISSTSLPPRSLLELGSMENDGCWHSWVGDYCLDVEIHVRNSLVQVCHDVEGKPVIPSSVYWSPVNEDSIDGNAVGLSRHPESRELIPVPNSGCAMTWIQFTPGKFLYPRLREGSHELLNSGAAEIVRQLFAGEFVQACEWG